MAHKITKQVMDSEEAARPTPCLTDPERWFPDEQKPDPYAVAACWSCHFQIGCARRAVEYQPEFGVWGGYRLAPGPGLKHTLAQLEIVAGRQMGPAVPPAPEVVAALEDLAGITPRNTAAAQTDDADFYPPLELAPTPVDLAWREPSVEELAAAAHEEAAALAYEIDLLVDARGQILLPIDGEGDRSPVVVKRAS